MVVAPTDAIAFYSGAADRFHDSYKADANRIERVQVWRSFMDRYLSGADLAYDLGCGSGILACEMARRGIAVVGVDGAAGMLDIARRSAAEAGLTGIQFKQYRLPIKDTAGWPVADAVISSSALEYLDSLPEALGSIHRLLRQGGTLVFSVSNKDSLSRRLVRAVHRLTGRPAYFGLLKQFATMDELRDMLTAAGFAYLEGRHFACADRVNRLLGRVMPLRFASNMIIVAARRV
jgi:SAM-dependent methyltransferase